MYDIKKYNEVIEASSPPPLRWADSCTHQECSLHQLSPYIGKLKSVIAQDLILKYSKPGQLVADMFCGSGTVPLEAARLGRQVFASDMSQYAVTLTKGKLHAPTRSNPHLQTLIAFSSASNPCPCLTSAVSPDGFELSFILAH